VIKFFARVFGTGVLVMLFLLLIYGLGQLAIALGMNDEHRGPATLDDILHVAVFFCGLVLAIVTMFVLALAFEIMWGFNPKQLMDKERHDREFFDDR
jgi:hypothetical protein